MTVLVPGLIGLAASLLALPVLVHLWSRRPARVVAVGSVKLLAGARPSQARRLALSDLPLLALRMLILALAGLAAAGLAWRASRHTPERIALLAPSADATRLADSLRALGWTTHLLQPGLPLLAAETPVAGLAVAPLWSMLRDAAERFPTADSVLIAAPVTAASLDGTRPVVPFGVRLLRRGAAVPKPDTLALCVDGPTDPRDLARLRAALDAIAGASGSAAALATSGCAASSASVISLTAFEGGSLRRNAQLGRWELAPAALQRADVIDQLTELLDVRQREQLAVEVPDAAALPTVVRSSTTAPAASWTLPLAIGALVLFAFERLLATRRRAGARTVADGAA